LRFGANAQNGSLARSANPEMAAVEKEIDAMFLELNGIGRGIRNSLDDFDSGDADFETARSGRRR